MCHLKVGCPIYYKIIVHWGKLNWSLHNWSCLCSNQGRWSRWDKGQLSIPSNLLLAKSIAKNNIDQLSKGMLFFFFLFAFFWLTFWKLNPIVRSVYAIDVHLFLFFLNLFSYVIFVLCLYASNLSGLKIVLNLHWKY